MRPNVAKNVGAVTGSTWTGERIVIPYESCGYCATGHHGGCRGEIGYFEKLWVCGCECNADWVPIAVIVNNETKENNEKRLEKALQEKQATYQSARTSEESLSNQGLDFEGRQGQMDSGQEGKLD